MVPGNNGFPTQICANKIKIPDQANVLNQTTSLDILKLPSPRLMLISFEKAASVLNFAEYENIELRRILPGLFSFKN